MKRRICAASYSSGLPETVTSTSDTFTLPRWTERHYAAMADVLLIETDVQLTRLIEWIIEGAGHQVRTVARPPDARTELAAAAPDIVVFNSGASRDEKRLLIRSFRDIVPGLRVIDMDENASHPSHDTGADDYIDKPFHADDLIAAIERLARQRTEQDT